MKEEGGNRGLLFDRVSCSIFSMRLTSVEYIKGCAAIEDYPKEHLPEIAFIGRSNVGKSSLINFLLGRKIAYVSSTPGKTQLIHFFKINRNFYLVDLPGYGYAKAPISVRMQWGPMIETYLTKRKQLKGIVLLIDLRHPTAFLDQEMKKWLDHFQVPTLYVATKADKIGRNQRKKQIEAVKTSFGICDVIVTSAQNKEGKDPLWKEVERVVLGEKDG